MLGFVSLAQAATIVVDPAGGGDALSIAEALTVAADGDTIQIEPGVYYESNLENEVDNLTLEGAGVGLTVIDTAGVVGAAPNFRGNITVRDISFLGDPGREQWGIIYKSWWPGSVALFERCSFESFEVGIAARGSYDTLYVYDSTFENIEDWGIVTGYLVGGSSLHVENNVFTDMDNYAVVTEYDWTDQEGSVHEIVHNTFVDNLRVFYRASWGDVQATVHFLGNVVDGTVVDGAVVLSGELQPEDVIEGNLYHDVPGWLSVRSVVSDNLEHDVEADPEFCSFDQDGALVDQDLRLKAGSPAVDLFEALEGASSTDHDGLERPLDGDGDGLAWSDAGAYELDPSAPCGVPVEPEDTGDSAVLDTQDSRVDSPVDSPMDSPIDSQDSPPGDSTPSVTPEPEPTCGCSGTGAWLALPGLLLLLVGRRRHGARC